jgi:Uncharacterized protein conserved in bacteria
MRKITKEQALHRLAAYCSRAERCMFDLRKKMDGWELPLSEQNEIIDRLKKENFLNEERFCRAFVKDKLRLNAWGARKIKYELQKKQIKASLIESALQNIDNKENKERLKLLLEQKKRTIRGKDEYDVQQKLIRFALGRGFSLEDILQIVKN